MSQAALARMDADTFLEWCLDQNGKFELVDGQPVEMMAGATRRHDRIVVNLIRHLGNRLSGSACVPQTDDVAARMVSGNIRRPDVTIDCGQGRNTDLTSTEPRVFFEVLSPSTQSFDFITKSEEYKQVGTLRHFALIHPDRPVVRYWNRGVEGGWTGGLVEGLDGELMLAGIGTTLLMSEIYEGVTFNPA